MNVGSFLSCSAWSSLLFAASARVFVVRQCCTIPLDLFVGTPSVLLGKVLKPVSISFLLVFTCHRLLASSLLRASSGFVFVFVCLYRQLLLFSFFLVVSLFCPFCWLCPVHFSCFVFPISQPVSVLCFSWGFYPCSLSPFCYFVLVLGFISSIWCIGELTACMK